MPKALARAKPSDLCADGFQGPQDPAAPAQAIETSADEGPLLFSNTAVGGTFDRLHAGHRILLATTALVTTEMVFVGVTSRLLLVLSHLSCTHGSAYLPVRRQYASIDIWQAPLAICAAMCTQQDMTCQRCTCMLGLKAPV